MTAYLKRMPSGIVGEVSRRGTLTLEPGRVGATAIPYGTFAKLGTGGVLAPVASGDTAAVVYGPIARPYPDQGNANNDVGPVSAPAGSVQSVLRSGYMTVKLAAGTAAKGGQVYLRTTVGEGRAVGDIEAASGTGLVAVASCTFMGPADSEGIVEIAYNI